MLWLTARRPTFMKFDRFAGFFAASAVCLTMAIVLWTGVVGPIWRATYTATPDQWLGFVGSLIGAVATVAAGLTALFAAYKTLSPMRAQLDQLIKQNDHILYDRMRKRAADLNEEIILIEQICGDCAVVDRTLEEFLRAGASIVSSPKPFAEAVTRLSISVGNVQKARGEMWGDGRIQMERSAFIDQALMASTLASGWLGMVDTQRHIAIVLINRELSKWHQHRNAVADLGGRLHAKTQHEMRRAGQTISELEFRLFTRCPDLIPPPPAPAPPIMDRDGADES